MLLLKELLARREAYTQNKGVVPTFIYISSEQLKELEKELRENVTMYPINAEQRRRSGCRMRVLGMTVIPRASGRFFVSHTLQDVRHCDACLDNLSDPASFIDGEGNSSWMSDCKDCEAEQKLAANWKQLLFLEQKAVELDDKLATLRHEIFGGDYE